MRELHVVALSDDGRHVILATRAGVASGEFRVALDERLSAAVRGELPAPGRDAPPSISPRDIQARLRDGQAPEQIAASAGVPLSRVERYAGPVLAELERMITGARAAVVTRPRLGASALPLGEAVEAHLADVAHLAEGSVRWSARRTDHGRWVVEVSWTARGRRRTAGWHYDPTTREVVAVDGPSAVLGHVEAEGAAAAPAGRSARAAAPVRSVGRAGSAASPPRSPAAAPASGGRPVRSPAAPAAAPPATASPSSGSSRAARPSTPTGGGGATARTSSPRRSSPPAAPAAAAPVPVPRRRSAATPDPAAAPARRRPASQAAATATPARRTSTRSAPAAGTPTPPRGSARTGRAPSGRAVPRRSAVPPVEELAAPTAATTAPPDPSPTPPATQTPAQDRAPLPGPPVLRVVPPADPGPAHDAQDDAPLAEPRPARRAAGQRTGSRDWADVLMGAAPAPPAGEPRQD